jgi:CDP-paratose 2-epimerase
MTTLCEKITGNTIDIKQIPENRTADIRIYITDNSKVTEKTGWIPQISPEEIFRQIYVWIKENEAQLAAILK